MAQWCGPRARLRRGKGEQSVSDLGVYLAKFENMIDPAHYERIERAFRDLFAWRDVREAPFLWSTLPPVHDDDWPDPAYNDTVGDCEKMLLSQLRPCFFHYQAGDDHPLCIRANYGTVILPSIFGAEWQLTESSMPWAHHLPGRNAIRALIDRGIPDLREGLGAACFDTASYYREILAPYPKLARYCRIYHPDLQGPFDVAHLLWGPDIFLCLYDDPGLVHALLDLVTETYIVWLGAWCEQVAEDESWTAHWSFLMRGATMIRDDTPVMMNTAQYEEFVKPYDQRILDAFGGCIHYCGRADQFIASMAESRNLYGVNMSQPELNDMDLFWRSVQENGLVVLGMPEAHVPANVGAGVVIYRAFAG